MPNIGPAHGITAWLTWMRATFPEVCQRSANWKQTDPQTWPWPERYWRTMILLHQQHDVLPAQDVIPPAPPEPAPPVTKSMFADDGWMAVDFSALPSPTELKNYGIKWIAGVLSHGANGDGSHAANFEDDKNRAWLAAGNAAAYRAQGIAVGGWQFNQGTHPEVEAWIAAELVKVYKLDFFIANGEEAWKGIPPVGQSLPERWASTFIRELTSRGIVATSFPVAWSVLGAATGTNVFPFDYLAFVSRNWHILPQSYPQESGEYTLWPKDGNQGCVLHGRRAEIPDRLVHPTIANYEPRKTGAFKPTIEQWCADLNRAEADGISGHSLWAHHWNPDDLTKLATV